MLSSDWLSFPGLDSNFPGLAKGSDWFPFPGLAMDFDWSQGGGVRLRDFQKALFQEFLQNGIFFNKME